MLTEREAIVAAYLRGVAVAQNNQNGLMMAIGCQLSYIQPLVDKFDGEIVVACHNSLESYTLSGDADAIVQLKKTLDEEKIFCRLLSTNNNAYHSHHMKATSKFAHLSRWIRKKSKMPKHGPQKRSSSLQFLVTLLLGHYWVRSIGGRIWSLRCSFTTPSQT